jgi:hypothetical protein
LGPKGANVAPSDKAAVKAFADWARVPEAIVRLAPEDYYPKNSVLPDRIEGLDLAMADTVSFKYNRRAVDERAARDVDIGSLQIGSVSVSVSVSGSLASRMQSFI